VAWAWTSTETGRATPRSGPAWARASPWAKMSKTSTQPITATATPDGDAEERAGLGSDPEGVDSDFSDATTEGGDTASG
jgi:hypothetical protein